jgi:hypothetical protein
VTETVEWSLVTHTRRAEPRPMPEEELWEWVPEELLTKVLDRLEWAPRDSGAVRGTCRRWRAAHDAMSYTACAERRDGRGVVRAVWAAAGVQSLTAVWDCAWWGA